MKPVSMSLRWTLRSAALTVLLTATATQAVLIDRGGGMIYDTVLDITWLQDANYAYTSGYSTANGGRMNWQDARTWAAGLDYGGFHDWRLPHVTPSNGSYFVYGDLPSHPSNSYSGLTDLGFNVAHPQSELGYMFYVNLGNTGYYDTAGNAIPGYDNVNAGPFVNLQHYFYWYGTAYDYSPNNLGTFCAPPTYCAWDFVVGYGDQTIYQQSMPFYAWAVRDGDVVPTNRLTYQGVTVTTKLVGNVLDVEIDAAGRNGTWASAMYIDSIELSDIGTFGSVTIGGAGSGWTLSNGPLNASGCKAGNPEEAICAQGTPVALSDDMHFQLTFDSNATLDTTAPYLKIRFLDSRFKKAGSLLSQPIPQPTY